MNMGSRIAEIVRKEFRQALREPRMRVFLFLPPILQTLIFGYAVNMDVEQVKLGWMDLDRGPAARELFHAFDATHEFRIVARASDENAAQALLDRGEVQALVRIAPGFSRDVAAHRQGQVQLLLDGTNSNTAAIILSHATGVVAGFNRRALLRQQKERLVDRTRAGAVLARIPGLEAERRVWFNPELRSRNYFVPGVIVNVLTLVTLMLTALSIVREKEIGTMEQLLVSPIRPLELLLGKTIPFIIISLLDVVLVTIIAILWFDVPFRGNPLVLLLGTILFLFCTVGGGLLISTISSTQQQAMMVSVFFFMPAILLSGLVFPIHNMPWLAQLFTYINPLSYFIIVVQDIFLKGVGLEVLWPEFLAMAILGILLLSLSVLRFHHRRA